MIVCSEPLSASAVVSARAVSCRLAVRRARCAELIASCQAASGAYTTSCSINSVAAPGRYESIAARTPLA